MSLQQAFVAGLIGRPNFEFLREAPSAKNSRIDVVKVVRGPDQKDVVLCLQFADQASGLLDQLNVVLSLKACVSREQTVHFMPTGLAYSNAAHAVEVEVDPATGAVRILRYVVVSDCGQQINPMIVEGQITGGVVHGIGNALFERMHYDETAQPLSTNFADYLLPTATELPRIELFSHVSPSPLNPLGVKGVGECGVIPAAAAIISAIEHALDAFGIRIVETPISPARIVELVNSASSATTAPIARMRSTS